MRAFAAPDPLNFQMLTFGADLSELRNRELNNGRQGDKKGAGAEEQAFAFIVRFAMFATLGILAAWVPAPDRAGREGLGAAPRRSWQRARTDGLRASKRRALLSLSLNPDVALLVLRCTRKVAAQSPRSRSLPEDAVEQLGLA